ncbi:hypothetical protein ACN2XU_02620 [Primorskyibacter sp. 2E107]|uniref:hypothetical protein n=1 Tax=Primorskyibacter sp. 2E107 TaxID=3403458 RepID=UPI003AF9B890
MNGMDRATKLLAAAEGASAATCDMIECARSNADLRHPDNVSAGDTVHQLADSLRLLVECMPELNEDAAQLQGALIRFIEAG